MEQFLSSYRYIDSNHPKIINYANKLCSGIKDDKDKAIALYYRIRDDFRYNPFLLNLTDEGICSSNLLERNYGYCVEKASLLVATARAVGIPARMAFANVRNHIGTSKLEEILETDIYTFHGYAELFLGERWIKVTPAFNKSLCEYLGVKPLEFDGINDSFLQQFDKSGNHMEFLHFYGTFEDIPFDLMLTELRVAYPHLAKYFVRGILDFKSLRVELGYLN
ncbi:transglutaminase-like domain-containing protein [Marinigracilibium pacificum]|uniref:Transglutaminase family protein n=1 Tax=Marinigracilibium pacificum TaxID=2729599 RepID=A0A848J0Z2_9BACT|nr:transglutaminase family protein [Marinigracilibium pacificum]NMM46912.1 transglutaminase family protein [Marinigracilibium pacificum]